MRKIRLIPFILAFALPITGCDFLNTKGGDSQKDHVLTEIVSVSAPETVEQYATLSESEVSIVLKYSDSKTETAHPERISLNTSTLGTATGTVFYGSLFKDFSTRVVEQGGGGSEKSFTELKDDVLANHNYTLDVTSYWVNFPTERFDGHMYNISDKAYYGTDPNYINLWESGYIKVKDQGIASFYWSLVSQQVMLETFVVSNPERTIYDVESCLVEFLLESQLTKVDELHYTSSNQELIGMMANFSGLELAYIQSPDHLDIYKVGSTLKIEFILTASYYDEESLDPIENEPAYVGVVIKEIGSTHNEVIEAFVEDPSKKVPAVTAWDQEAREDFAQYFNGLVPEFPTGATYSFSEHAKWDGYQQKHFIKCQDLASGDLRTSYASQLAKDGFEPVDGIYRKTVKNEEETQEYVYEAEMTYYSPSAQYPNQEHTYGYYYLNGVFQIVFTCYTKIIAAVTDVESLNTYLASTAAASRLPEFPSTFNSTKVASFKDATETTNQLHGGGFVFTTGLTSWFKIKVEDFSQAQAFYSAFRSAALAKGYTDEEEDSFNHTISFGDYTNSVIVLTNPDQYESSTYPGYLQCRIVIREYTATYSLTINVDDGISSKTVIEPYNYMKIEFGTKVKFSFVVADGYELDKIVANVDGLLIMQDTSGTNLYYFNMPDKNVTITISTKSTAASEGLEYEHHYVVYMGKSDATPYDEMPIDIAASIKLDLLFHDDGTGSYTCTWFNKSGGINGGPHVITFSYTLVDGQFNFVSIDGTNNSLCWDYRLFTDGDAGSINNTGVFDSTLGTITMSVVKANGATHEVTLK